MRMLIEKGAKLNVLTDRKETVLDCFRSWLNRVTCELDEDEMREAREMEKDLERLIKYTKFDVTTSVNWPLNKRRTNKRSLSPDPLNERCSKSPSPGPGFFRMEDEDIIDFDNPDVARKEYVAAVTSMRRQQGNNRRSLPFVGSKRALSAKNSINSLLEEREGVTDDWLIDDIGQSRPTNKKAETNPYEFGESRGLSSRRMGLSDIVDNNHKESRNRNSKSQPVRRKNNRSDDIIVDDADSNSEPIEALSPRCVNSQPEYMDADYIDDEEYRAPPTPPPLSLLR